MQMHQGEQHSDSDCLTMTSGHFMASDFTDPYLSERIGSNPSDPACYPHPPPWRGLDLVPPASDSDFPRWNDESAGWDVGSGQRFIGDYLGAHGVEPGASFSANTLGVRVTVSDCR